MSSNKQILNDIRTEVGRLSNAIDGVYRDISYGHLDETSNTDLNGSHLPILRQLKRLAKRLGRPRETKPSFSEAIRLLHTRENEKAVAMLTVLSDNDDPSSALQLGKIYSTGIKNKVGTHEYNDPRKALEYLLKSQKLGKLEAGYLLGVIYYKYGKTEEAKMTLYLNHKKGCIRSSTELILIMQDELSVMQQDSKEAAIMRNYIQNIKTDIEK